MERALEASATGEVAPAVEIEQIPVPCDYPLAADPSLLDERGEVELDRDALCLRLPPCDVIEGALRRPVEPPTTRTPLRPITPRLNGRSPDVTITTPSPWGIPWRVDTTSFTEAAVTMVPREHAWNLPAPAGRNDLVEPEPHGP